MKTRAARKKDRVRFIRLDAIRQRCFQPKSGRSSDDCANAALLLQNQRNTPLTGFSTPQPTSNSIAPHDA
jgi:hypothetical protein